MGVERIVTGAGGGKSGEEWPGQIRRRGTGRTVGARKGERESREGSELSRTRVVPSREKAGGSQARKPGPGLTEGPLQHYLGSAKG